MSVGLEAERVRAAGLKGRAGWAGAAVGGWLRGVVPGALQEEEGDNKTDILTSHLCRFDVSGGCFSSALFFLYSVNSPPFPPPLPPPPPCAMRRDKMAAAGPRLPALWAVGGGAPGGGSCGAVTDTAGGGGARSASGGNGGGGGRKRRARSIPPLDLGSACAVGGFPLPPRSVPGLSQCLIAAFMTHHRPEWGGELCC